MSARDKQLIEEKKAQLIELTKGFSNKHLNEEYEIIILKMLNKMARKREVPFLTGKIEIWASAIIHAIGTVNFLFDKNTTPYTSVSDICDYFETKQSTVGQKSKLVRDMFKMTYFDQEFSTAEVADHNPLKNIIYVNGLPIPIDMLR